jgi:ATP-dependent protease Clp ATPase subunit
VLFILGGAFTGLERIIEQPSSRTGIDSVELEFTEDAVCAIAQQALLRGTGARATRAILEAVLLNVMYEVPSRDNLAKVVISRDTVLDNVNPTWCRESTPALNVTAAKGRPTGLSRRRTRCTLPPC